MKKRYFLGILILTTFTAINGQTTEQPNTSPDEHLEIILDNSYYLTGETVYYTIGYYSERHDLNPEGITVFAELLDSVNYKLASACNRINAEGYSRGAITIPASASSGYYILRFYTYRMMVQGPQTYQYKIIPVLNPEKGIPVVRDKDKYEGLHIEFHAEGNHWVSGLENKMMIKCRNFAGQALNCQALVIQNKRILDTLYFDQNGTASLIMIPHQDSLMKLLITIDDSIRKEFLFPHAEKTGTTLFVNRITLDSLYVKMGHNTTIPQKEKFTLWLKNSGKTLNNLTFQLNSKDTVLPFTIETMADGLYELQLTNEKKQVMNQISLYLERLNEPDVLIPRGSYKRGDSIRFEIRFRDAESAPEWITVSAGCRLDVLEHNADAGYGVQNFLSFRSQQSVSSYTEKYYEIPSDGKGLIITGYAKYRSTGNPAANVPVRIAITNSRKDIYNVCTDTSGIFHLVLKEITGQIIANFQPIKIGSDQEIDIIPLPQFSDDYVSFDLPKLTFPESKVDEINELAKIFFVERNYAGNSESFQSEKDHWTFYGKADEIIEMNDYIELPQMEEVFRELSRYIILTGSGKNIHIQVLDKYTNRITGNIPLIMIDGIPMDDHQKVLSIKPSTVKRISVVAGRYFYRNSRFDGIIDIELRKKNQGLYSEYMMKEYLGYDNNQKKQFPEYSEISRRIYWQPFMNGSNGIFHGAFKAGIIPGTYFICINGKDRKGRTVHKTAYVVVE